ncbi:MAG: Aldose 1-epimerase [Tardiphaga sp.]|nr:Aldose 1-epimerase [Tardiphaga sp.]
MSVAAVSRERFGQLADGRPVERLRLRNALGCEVCVISYGAAVQALHVPDRAGVFADIVLGHDDMTAYAAERRFFGASIGRYANRIAGASFRLGDTSYDLAVNDGPNALHGGRDGFDRKLWTVAALDHAPEPSVMLCLVSPHGDEGYPGTLHACVTYTWTRLCELHIKFEATTDRPTIVNLAHHGFFNLAGVETGGDVLDHRLTLYADRFLPVDPHAIPLGAPASVADSPFDFRAARAIGARIRQSHPQLAVGRGYDHNFCLNGESGRSPRAAARIEHPASGRAMEILTDQPGLQFYSGNFLDGSARGKFGRLYRQSDGVCLEPQGWPDAPNRPDYPSARLDPGQTYVNHSIYRFTTF